MRPSTRCTRLRPCIRASRASAAAIAVALSGTWNVGCAEPRDAGPVEPAGAITTEGGGGPDAGERLPSEAGAARTSPSAFVPSMATVEAVAIAPEARYPNILSIFGYNKTDIWAVGTGGLALHYDGSSWISTLTHTTRTLASVWASSPTDVWAVSSMKAIFRATFPMTGGIVWVALPPFPLDIVLSDSPLFAVWGTSADDVWVGGHNLYSTEGASLLKLHTDGSGAITSTFSPTHDLTLNLPDGASGFDSVQALWGPTDDDFWVAAQNGLGGAGFSGAGGIARATRTGTDVTFAHKEALASTGFLAIHGSSASNVWAVGRGGTVRAWDEATNRFRVVDCPTVASFHAVRVFANGEVWVAGDQSTLLTYDGAVWRQVAVTGAPVTLSALWGETPDDLWVGGDSRLLHVTRSGGQK